jgi:hypothetical protein
VNSAPPHGGSKGGGEGGTNPQALPASIQEHDLVHSFTDTSKSFFSSNKDVIAEQERNGGNNLNLRNC